MLSHKIKMKKQNRFKILSYLKSKPIRFIVILMVALTLFMFLEQRYLRFTRGIELDIQDWSMRWRNRNGTVASKDIVLIWVDKATIKRYNGAPPPRTVEAKLVEGLHQNGAKTIAFDFTFDLKREGTSDLAKASAEIDQLIYGLAFREVAEDNKLDSTPPLSQLTPFRLNELNRAPAKNYSLNRIPCPDLHPSIKYLGHIMFSVSFDGAVRHIPLIAKVEDKYYPALSLISVCLFKDVPLDGNGVTLKWGKYILLKDNKGWRRKIPIDKTGRMRLNYIGDRESFEQSYSFLTLASALNGELPEDTWRDHFDNKLVLIGDETSEADWTHTPFSGNFPGVAIHATAIDNILQGEFVHESSTLLTISLSLCFSGILVALQLWLFSPMSQKRDHGYWSKVAIGFTLLFCFAFLYVGFAVASFPIWGRFLNLTLPLVGMLLAWISVTYYCYGDELAEKRRLEHELELAREVQISLLPKDAPQIEGLELAGVTLPAQEVGGDYFDYLQQFDGEPNKIGIAVADVSGKGMKAAMVAVMSNCLLASASQNQIPANPAANLGDILTLINQILFQRTEKQMFTALCIATIDSKTLRMKYSNAGQCYPILKRRDQLRELNHDESQMPLGIMKIGSYQESPVQLESGDVVVFYTDGVIEAMNDADEIYQEERLKQSLLNSTGTAADYLDNILKDIDSFVAGARQYDDLTLVVVKVQDS